MPKRPSPNSRLSAPLFGALLLVAACGDSQTAASGVGDDASLVDPDDSQGTDTETADTETADTEPADTEPADTGTADSGDVAADSDPADTAPAFPSCPSFSAGTSAGVVGSTEIVEASGLAASQRTPNILWVHNDKGDSNRVFAITTTGAAAGTFILSGATATDWEDIAVGPGPDPDQSYVYVADIGDNSGNRNLVELYRFPEPAITGGTATTTLTNVEKIEFRYPNNEGNNAETLLVDPLSGDVYVVSKNNDGTAIIYRAAAPFLPLNPVTMTRLATLTFGVSPLSGDSSATGGDFSPVGDLFAIRTYDRTYAWRRPSGMTVEEALTYPPCPLPQRSESQGEAIAFNSTATGMYTMSEGSFVQLSYYARR